MFKGSSGHLKFDKNLIFQSLGIMAQAMVPGNLEKYLKIWDWVINNALEVWVNWDILPKKTR